MELKHLYFMLALNEDSIVKTNGGRVLAVTGMGNSIDEALKKSYATADKINWNGKNYRKDIGQDLLALEK